MKMLFLKEKSNVRCKIRNSQELCNVTTVYDVLHFKKHKGKGIIYSLFLSIIAVIWCVGNAQAELVGKGVVDEPFPVIDSAVCRVLFFRPDAVDRRRAASDEERDHAGEKKKRDT